MRKWLCLFFLIPMGLCSVHAGDKTKMLQDLDVIKSIFETKYAPFEWKKSHFGWSLEEQINLAKIKILTFDSLTVKDYQRILHSFFISTCDYHVHDSYYSTEFALLPFKVKGVNGKYFISGVNHNSLNTMKKLGLYQGKQLPEIGNQLFLFDSQPVDIVIEELKHAELGNAASRTTQILAEQVLTMRLGFAGHHVPTGPIKIRFQNSLGAIIDASINWLYNPEKVKNHTYYTLEPLNIDNECTLPFKIKEPSLMVNSLAEMLQKDYSHFFKHLKNNSPVENSHLEPESNSKSSQAIDRESIVFGKKIWADSSKNDYKVHIYQHPETNKRIGYIRISTFHPPVNLNDLNSMAMRLAKSICHLEANTDALVVDQVDNPGGLGIYALAIASMLIKGDEKLYLPQNHFTLTQADVYDALKQLDELEKLQMLHKNSPSKTTLPLNYIAGYPLDAAYIDEQIKFLKFIIDQWNKGNNFTDAYPLLGIEYLTPHPLAQYSKPILVLVNGNDFSCGDFFPAILQDNGRAVIFGEKTAGAGGAVENHQYPNSFGLAEFSLTVSIAERTNGQKIENLGVTPDISYDITEKDLLQGYSDYIKAVNKALNKM